MRTIVVASAALIAVVSLSQGADAQSRSARMRGGIPPVQAQSPASVPDQPPPDIAQADGPRGTSGEQQRYDAVGYAEIGIGGDPAAITISSDAVAPGSFVELTSLDTGRTIIALVAERGVPNGSIAGLSPGAARSLGVTADRAAIRLRAITPSAQDQGALRAGQSASARNDAPQALLAGLRKRLPASRAPVQTAHRGSLTRPQVEPERSGDAVVPRPARGTRSTPGASYAEPGDAVAATSRPAVTARRIASVQQPAANSAGSWYVQVATLSSLDRATALASTLGGGRIVSTGDLHRVQLGPYPNSASAVAARDAVAKRGYGSAQIIRPK